MPFVRHNQEQWLANNLDESLLTCNATGNSLSKSEHTVVNLGHEDGPPRLVSYIPTDLDNMRTTLAHDHSRSPV